MTKSQSSDPDKISNLYVEITDDLSYARTNYPKRSVRVYLNALSQKVYNTTYKGQRTSWKKLLDFWITDLPLQMYHARWAMLAGFIIFGIGMLIGMVSTEQDPYFLEVFTGPRYTYIAEENIAKGKPMDIYGSSGEALTFGQIALNNMSVALRAFILGIFFTLGSVLFLFYNAVMVGAFQWFYVVRNLALTSFLTIWIHGAFEIPSIIIASSAGITMGSGLLFPGTLTRFQSFVNSSKRGIKIMIGLIPFIITAAFIEGYATRHTVISTDNNPYESEWPDWLKWSFIIGCFLIILLYYVIYPFIVARKQNVSQIVEEPPQFKERSEVKYEKIKNFGELFSDGFESFRKSVKALVKFGWITFLAIPFFAYLILQRCGYNNYEVNLIELDFRFSDLFQSDAMAFQWENFGSGYDFFHLDLFLIQAFLFTSFSAAVLYSIKTKHNKQHRTWSSFLRYFFQKAWLLYIAFVGMGLLVAKTNIAIAMISTVVSPLLLIWFMPALLTDQSVFKSIGKGFKFSFKGYGNSIGLFYAMFAALYVISCCGAPFQQILDMGLSWFIIPLAEDPEFVLTLISLTLKLWICHFVFPIIISAFSMQFYSIKEMEEANHMFERLEKFGTRSKVYEDPELGTY